MAGKLRNDFMQIYLLTPPCEQKIYIFLFVLVDILVQSIFFAIKLLMVNDKHCIKVKTYGSDIKFFLMAKYGSVPGPH